MRDLQVCSLWCDVLRVLEGKRKKENRGRRKEGRGKEWYVPKRNGIKGKRRIGEKGERASNNNVEREQEEERRRKQEEGLFRIPTSSMGIIGYHHQGSTSS